MPTFFCSMRSTFKKEERLCSKKAIDELFADGSSFSTFPLRVIHLEKETIIDSSIKALFSVPKKRFKKAVDRNRIKRQLISAYRQNKSQLYPALENKNKSIHLAFVFTSSEPIPFKQIEDKIILSLQRLAKVYGESAELDPDRNN